MKKTLQTSFRVIILILFLTTCSSEPRSTISSVFTKTTNSLPSSTFVPPTNAIPTKTEPVFIPTSTSAKDVEGVKTCRDSGKPISANDNFNLSGSILTANHLQNKYSLIVGPGLIVQYLSIPWLSDIVGFSPNGEWIAWLEKERLKEISLTGRGNEVEIDIEFLKAKVPKEAVLAGWLNRYWRNTTQMYLQFAYYDSPDVLTSSVLEGYLDPFTGQWQNPWIESLPLKSDGPTFISPDGNRVFYFSNDLSGKLFILFNKSKDVELWSKPDSDNLSSGLMDYRLAPHMGGWSPDSSKFAFVDPTKDGNGIRILSNDGKEITYFQTMNRDIAPYGLKWSPDSRYLTYVDYSPKTKDIAPSKTILIYDTTQKEPAFRCPVYYEGKNDHDANVHLEWSPDNGYIAYTYFPQSPLILIDVNKGDVIQLSENVSLLGWSDKYWGLNQRKQYRRLYQKVPL